jgi:hypothetical protein
MASLPHVVPEGKDCSNARLHPAGEEEERRNGVKYHFLRSLLAGALICEADLARHSDGRKLGADFSEVEGAVPRLFGPHWRKLYVAIAFWDCWRAEARRRFPGNHLLRQDEWAPLACKLAADLHADREVTDPQILAVASLSNTLA